MKINEIFKSISGEARHAGQQAIFLRSYGCNLRCSYCDSMYSLEGNDYKEMTVLEIMQEVRALKTKHIVFTGGEPLLQPDAAELINQLLLEGHTVEIETNGAVQFDKYQREGVSITLDYKSPSSKMESKMLPVEAMCLLTGNDTLKFVLAKDDFNSAKERIMQMELLYTECNVAQKDRPIYYLSPVFGQVEPKEIVEFMLKELSFVQERVKFQLQIHKFVWEPNERGV